MAGVAAGWHPPYRCRRGASLVGSDPPNGAVRGPSLGQIVAHYDLPLQAETSTIQIFSATGPQVDLGDGRVDPADPSRQTMVVHLPNPLPPGAYVVHWHALSDKGLHAGHVTEGEFSFWVAEAAGKLHPGWALASLGVLGALLNALVIIRAQAGEGGSAMGLMLHIERERKCSRYDSVSRNGLLPAPRLWRC